MVDVPSTSGLQPSWRSHLLIEGALFDALPAPVRGLVVTNFDCCRECPTGTAARVAVESMCHLLARHVALMHPGATSASSAGVHLPGALVAAVTDATFSAVDVALSSIVGPKSAAWCKPELWAEVDCALRRAVVAKALAATGGRYSAEAVLTAIQSVAFILAWSIGSQGPESCRSLLEQQVFLRARDAAYEAWKRFEAAKLPSRFISKRLAAKIAASR